MVTLLGLLGCIWVDQTEYNDMRDALLDFDSDGFQTVDEGGSDCDDTDPAVYPGAQETWYDGVDSDCAGDDDYDRDGDGAAAVAYGGEDCDDGDAEIGPQATEIWYDGLDQDCDGGSDYDADGDGYTSADHEGDDCDDEEASAHPGGTEVWYDGIDGDCDGADDHDADADGYPMGDLPGDDCDDTDPDRNPTTLEQLGDKLDSDCDGGANSFGFPHVSTMDVTGYQGPVVRVSQSEISVGYAAEEITDPSDGYTVYDSLSVIAFNSNSFGDGPVLDYPFGFDSSSGTMGDQFDFWSDGDHYIWASLLYKEGVNKRLLYLDAIDFTAPPNNDIGSVSITDNEAANPYTGMDLSVDEDGLITMVACDASSPSLAFVQDTVDDFVPDATLDVKVTVDEGYDLCEVANGGGGSVWVTSPDETGLSSGEVKSEEWDHDGPIDLDGVPVGAWTVVDLEIEAFHGRIWTLVLDLAEGVYLWDGEDIEHIQPEGSGLVQADIAADGDGNAYLCGVSEAGQLRFWYGQLGAMAELELATGLTTVEQCSLDASATGLVIVAVRGDDQLIVGGVKRAAE